MASNGVVDMDVSCQPMTSEDYHADKSAWSKGMLWDFLERRSVCHARHILGTAPEKKMSRVVDIGDVAHVALLQPDKLATHYVTFPKEVLAKNGAVSTNAAEAFKAEHEKAGKVVLKQREFEIVEAMVRAICASKVGKWFTVPAKVEHAIYWTDERSELRCKCRPDFLVVKNDVCVVLDIKTTGDASPAEFQRRVESMGYWLQDAHYSAGVRAKFGLEPVFLFVAVETEWPYDCGVYELSPGDKALASDARDQLMLDVATCYETDTWIDGWTQDINQLSLRKYIYGNR